MASNRKGSRTTRAARRAARRAKRNGEPVNDQSDYEVGYGKPPLATRFKKGTSGNPNGRPKGALDFDTIVRREARRKIRLREGNKVRSVTRAEAIVMKIIEGALKGDPKAVSNFMKLSGALHHSHNAESQVDQLTDAEAAVLDELLHRSRR
ncbi:MAG: hypothetical protein KF807_00105 [Xanthobacteraceae bacterium]|nr:hypothetical protein [Xanthobacteraceae bacterium]